MRKSFYHFLIALFLLFLFGFFLLNLFVPAREFSEQENRYLQQFPDLSLKKILTGDFMSDFEKYSSDQFVFRDWWITLKSRLELIQGKRENNGVFLCEGQRLIKPFTAVSMQEIDTRISLINQFDEECNATIVLGLIPESAEIYRDYLPKGVPNSSQHEIIEYVYNGVTTKTADIFGNLSANKTQDIFYRTDHHWTSLGAYYGYEALTYPLSIQDARRQNDFHVMTVSNQFFGTSFSASGFSWISPDSIQTFVDPPEQLTIIRTDGNKSEEIPLYDVQKLETKDKYSYFLGGNTPLLTIKTGTIGKPSILLIRDSFADSLAPFLIDSFSEIHMIDLRYYHSSVLDYIEKNEIDNVLILYSVSDFCTEESIRFLGM